ACAAGAGRVRAGALGRAASAARRRPLERGQPARAPERTAGRPLGGLLDEAPDADGGHEAAAGCAACTRPRGGCACMRQARTEHEPDKSQGSWRHGAWGHRPWPWRRAGPNGPPGGDDPMLQLRLCWNDDVRRLKAESERGSAWAPASEELRHYFEAMVQAGNAVFGPGTHWLEQRHASELSPSPEKEVAQLIADSMQAWIDGALKRHLAFFLESA